MAETDVRKLRDAYASQAKFADHEAAAHFRDFVRRLDEALSRPPQPEVSGEDRTDHAYAVRRLTSLIEEHGSAADRLALKTLAAARSPSAPTGEGRLREAIREACDLLAERTYGSRARSPAHNARVFLEATLAAPSDPPQEVERCVDGLPDCGPPVASRFEDAPLVCQRCDDAEYAAQVREGFAAPSDPPQEVERYREALETILDMCPATCEVTTASMMADTARAALQPEA